MKNIYLLSTMLVFTISFAQNEFSQGPYGTGYFDTAAPFSLVDLNVQPQGDINSDEVINIIDVIDLVNCVLYQNCYETYDITNDGVIDVIDIVQIVNFILGN